MELAFSERSLRRLCESREAADRRLGAKTAEKLRRRLADLHAAACVMDLVAGKPRELEDGQYTVDIFGGCRIVFCSNHSTVPRLTSGGIDWSKVSRVKIVKIENTNDQN